MTRKDVIEKTLAMFYSRTGKTKGTMVESLAEHLDKVWNDPPQYPRDEDQHYRIHMIIWNWFPGGGTADLAAGAVLRAVEELADASTS
jgi:hypothetical protein